jgi:hypothetical protein
LVLMAGRRTTILCSQPRCRTPVLIIDGDSVLVGTRHHGEHHENRIGIGEIVESAMRSGLSPFLRRRLLEMLSDE